MAKCWTAFKGLFPTEDLSAFNKVIEDLDKFENIRYPDEIIESGAGIGFGFGKFRPYSVPDPLAVNQVPEYALAIGDVDAFFAKAMALCHMNPKPYFWFLTEVGREMLQKHNEESKNWI